MPDPTPTRPAADRNLLCGILALQMDFISRDALIQAMHAWVLEKTKPLGQILLEQGTLRPDTLPLLEALVQKHLELHGHDAQQSLAALSSLGSVRNDLEQVADPEVQASLRQVSVARPAGDDSHPTRNLDDDYSPPAFKSSVGTPTSSGLRFQILRPHAKGGLGQVSVALDAELNREVALKEIQPQYADDPESRARFLLEAEITGGLEHPGIVPVHGLGSYADGRPFYAMRFIKGDSLKDAVQRFHAAEKPSRDPGERTLALRELLGRFVAVCQAVAYAHSRGVLHRDLKPGNVMVGRYGETLLVDWGLAKPLGRAEGDVPSAEGPLKPASASGATPTQMGAVLGTPAYMSPEQAAGRLDQLGPASDVYSLGATLYSLLTGRPPFAERDHGALLQQVQRGEFPRPRLVKPNVPAALEAVCLKAMALRPEDRYARTLELATEVEHWLADEPVNCYREPYRVRVARWVRRHQSVAASSLVLLLTAAAGLSVALYFINAEKNRTEAARQGEAAQRQAAEQAAADSRAVLDFFQDHVLAAARPENQNRGLGIKATIRQAVDAAEPQIADTFHDRPLVEASIRNTLGMTYSYLRQDRAAIAQFERALALRHAHLDPNHPDTLTTMSNLGNAYRAAGQNDKALPFLEQVLARRQETLGPDHPDTLNSMNNLAGAYMAAGQLDKALPLYEQALAKRQETLGPDHPSTLYSMNNLATAYQDAGRLDKALPLYEQALAKFQEKLGPDHPDTLTSVNSLASAYQATGQLAKAVPLYEQALAKRQEKLGPDHPDTLTSVNNLASAYQATGQLAKAVPLLEQALAKRQEKLGPDHPDTLNSLNSLANAYRATGQLAKAVPLLEQALAKQKEKLGPDHPHTLTTMNNLAVVYKDTGQLGKALPLFEEVLAKQKEKLGPDHPSTLVSLNNLATVYEAVGQLEKALPLWEQVLAKFQEKLGPDHPLTLATMSNLAGVYQMVGQRDKALPLLEQALAKQKEKLGPDHPFTLTTMSNLGNAYRAAGQPEKALPLLEQALAKKTDKLGPDHPGTLATMLHLARAYQAAGQLEKALPLLERALAKRREKLAPDHPDTLLTMNILADVYQARGDLAKAQPILRECLTRRQQKQPEAWLTFYTQSQLGATLLGQKQYAAAEPLLRAGYEGLNQRQAQIPAYAKKYLAEALDRLVQLYDAWGKPDEAARWRAELDKLPKPPEPPTAK
jgi:tetratricopeptide (TPR) repeat protein/serine/threonine protein kinase